MERIAKVAARVNSSKTAGPVARVLRDATLAVILKLIANSKQVTQQYRYHIDWRTPISSVTVRQLRPSPDQRAPPRQAGRELVSQATFSRPLDLPATREVR